MSKSSIVCSVFDKKSRTFSLPQVFANEEVARRSCALAMRDPDSVFALYPEDYCLVVLATWDNMDFENPLVIYPAEIASQSVINFTDLVVK